jgi:hypothetical protein
MSIRARHVWRAGVLATLLAVLGPATGSAPSACAQPAPDTSVAPADTLPLGHPNRTPYRSEQSFAEHVLGAPAYALHLVTRPMAWAVREAEKRVPQVPEGQLPSYGAYPVFETGGTSGFAGGAVLFYNDLPWGGHNAEARVLVGSRAYNRFEAQYEVPSALAATTLRLHGRLANDPRKRFYLGGNAADEETDRRFYAEREIGVAFEADADGTERVATEGRLRYQYVNVKPGSAALDDDDEVRLPGGLPGAGRTALASAEAEATFDLTSQTARSVEGTRLRLGAAYAQDVAGSNDFRFLRYRAEGVQFVPLPLLPSERRLALRGLLEKTEPLGDDARVPFFRRPSLGGSERLRGYRTNRFQARGALLLTAEYRWPVWDNLDAVLFAETGQVFARHAELGFGRFHTGYGGGFHLVTGGKLNARFELAGSPEGVRTILTVQPAF